jgi:hypothetical protein
VTVVSTSGRRGPGYARNLGAGIARGGILLFVDADVVVPPDALARIAARFSEDPARDAVIGSYDQDPASPDLLSQYRNLLHCYTHQRGQARTCGFWTGCGAMRTAVFREYGGFDETHTRPRIEDVELGTRLRQAGRQVWLDKGLRVKHLKRLRFWTVMRTDLVDRAIPWTLLILRSNQMPADLNLQAGQRYSVLASGWAALALILSVVCARPFGGRIRGGSGPLGHDSRCSRDGPEFRLLSLPRSRAEPLVLPACVPSALPLLPVCRRRIRGGACLACWVSARASEPCGRQAVVRGSGGIPGGACEFAGWSDAGSHTFVLRRAPGTL